MSTALLLSGGIDSIALAFWKRPEIAITVDYGQKAAIAEIQTSATICQKLNIRHEVIHANCTAIGQGCMSDENGVPDALSPPTLEWWPFRNQLIITIAAAKAVVLGCRYLCIGTVCSDMRHRDGTSEFIMQMSKLLLLQEGELALLAPAIQMTSDNLVIRSGIPPTLLAWAHSCHTGDYACGICPGCIKNSQVWEQVISRKSNWLDDTH